MPDKAQIHLPRSVHGKSAKEVARYAAIESGIILKTRLGVPNATTIKGKRNLVTEVDILSENKIIEILGEEFPSHSILSEESGAIESDCEYTWIIDPLDGTNNYYFGIPYFCVNIALTCKDDVILGITYDPMRSEIFDSVAGQGTCFNGKSVMVASVRSLEKSCIGVDLGYQADISDMVLGTMAKLWPQTHCIRLMGSASLGLAYVACGRLSLYFHRCLYPWDIASGLLLVREAGGMVSNFAGKSAVIDDEEIIAANSHLLNVFLQWLNKH